MPHVAAQLLLLAEIGQWISRKPATHSRSPSTAIGRCRLVGDNVAALRSSTAGVHRPSSCPRSIGHGSVHLPDFCASMSPHVRRHERHSVCGFHYGFLTFEPTLRTTGRAFSNHLTDGGTVTRCTYASGDVGDVQSSPFTAAPSPSLASCQPHSQTSKSLAPEAVLMPQ